MAAGSCKVWLNPHIVDATVELWYRSYGADVRTGIFIQPGWGGGDPLAEPYIYPGSPFTSYDLYTVKFPEQTVGGVRYQATELGYDFTFQGDTEYILDITPFAEEGKASIIEVSLPDKLTKDSWITGYVRIKNIGTATARFRHFLTTEWNGKESKTEADLRSGDILRVNFYEGGLIMPSQDAAMTIRAQRWKDGVWITDDIKTH